MSLIHLLHIGKTGGTALRHALRLEAPMRGILPRRHDIGLADIPAGEKVILSVREPIGRFVSAFNSRLRKGQPRYLYEWSEQERLAFTAFPTANDLAEALSSPAMETRERAAAAMRSIYHVSHSLKKWLVSTDYLRSREPDILFVFDQAHLTADFAAFTKLLGLPPELRLPDDPVSAHKAPATLPRQLSPDAIRNLRSWYEDDFAIHHACLRLREARLVSTEPA